MKMYQKLALSLLICVCAPQFLRAQSELRATAKEALATITVENHEGEPESSAKIIINNKKGTFKKNGVSDVDGHFKVLLPMADTFDFRIEKYDTAFAFTDVAIPERPFGFNLPITFKIQVVTMEYINLSDIFLFYEDQEFQLTDTHKSKVQGLIRELINTPEAELEVGGHADPSELAKRERNVSLKRAEVFRDYLVSQGIAGERIKVIDYKSDKPITLVKENATNPNRHVELKFVD